MVINKFIHRIGIKGRLIQVEFDKNSLFISLYPEALGLYVDATLSDFEKLTYFDEHLSGSRFIEIMQIDFKPVVDLITERIDYGQKKVANLRLSFYREAPNFTIIFDDVSKHLFPRYVEKETKNSILNARYEDLQDKKSLIKNFEGLDKSLSQELDIKNFERLKLILKGKFYKPKLVSTAPLRISFFAEKYIGEYFSWNKIFADGIKEYLLQKEKSDLLHRRQTLIKKIEKRIEELEKMKGDKESMEYNRVVGELILMNLSKIKKGAENIRIFNPYTQQEIEVRLNPTKGPQENAELYFKKYKKLKHGLPKIEERIRRLKKQLELLKSEAYMAKTPSRLSKDSRTTESEASPFRKFILPSGSIVYVGKDAHSNMELTFRFARPDDYFFHVRGYEGAHTILRPAMQKGQNVRKDDIEKAGAIAAYFSKAKKQKNVPVSYTQRKYLKKSKKGKLGTVVLMREDVIFADPNLPPDT